MSETKLFEYGLRPAGSIRIIDDNFIVEFIDSNLAAQSRCIYAFLVEDEVIRVGSSQNPLRNRMKQWQRDVSKALKGLPSHTRPQEAAVWRDVLTGTYGRIFARMGMVAFSPFGELNIFQVEEAALIAKFQPRLCWDRVRHKNAQFSN
jgi:hypothetical protein